jgi:hypothetical protein
LHAWQVQHGVLVRGLKGGSNNIEYITIATTGNATTFGTMTSSRSDAVGNSSSTRGVFGGGTGDSNVMDYVTIATTGNATDFGDLTAGRISLAGGVSTFAAT